ncbi:MULTISPECIES: ABC transporter permease [unclassified Mycolicibacterium]|uniref:ABC transporter permease n=1 Tax=unclassified Mycolicibacterium TaxID=2636767 RepID=UPI0012DE691B|nr:MULTISPECIES: ABC transporter permease subunit [unclassified Mycolicibacterium]MUL81137.1 ABC transporter permease subunit [Mycolicibacterium sp. CBMA 329]MUL86903.1 ABC transporter permease subunit [Mycolicibacterium sp. CBMA 331]MUL98813.1 ABC transporter permease subunit [Mycolicibacterium sp. CBMA 334]MUM37200.1 ABC transporter permease subunit [Mycolicibacterium sp. CBMA 247]MUM42968.1 ABC transporter permease subunit [Mycolicibacterium sp. CBMA 294]
MAGMTRTGWGRRGVLAVAAVYFAAPMVCALLFSIGVGSPDARVSFDAYSGIAGADGLADSLILTLKLAAATIVVVLAVLVPALIAIRLNAARLRPVVEVVCLLPLVVPGVALGAGISTVLRWGTDQFYGGPLFDGLVALQAPEFPIVIVLAYSLMALPLAYSTLDSGLAALDLRVLVEAARSCGSSWLRTLFFVVLPNLRGALLNASFLTLALVLGEYTVAALLGYQPFAVWIVVISGSQAQMSVAVSIVSLLGTWALLLAVAAAGRSRRIKETA